MGSKNYFADDGWAVWVNGDDTSTIYFNEWINPGGRSYVDVGIRVVGLPETHDLNVYAPFKLEAEEIEDISFKLQDKNIFRAVLSSTGLYEPMKNDCTSELAYHGRAMDLVHISKTNWSLYPVSDGTLITVDVDALRPCLDNEEAYFLFRIPHKSLDQIFHAKPSFRGVFRRLRDNVSSPIVEEKYGYSIRINEPRRLPLEITKIGVFHRQKLSKAKITIALHQSYKINDGGCRRIHRMESELYRNYIPRGLRCDDYICYHWTQTRQDSLRGHFSFFYEITRSHIGRGSMVLYLILLILAGAAGNATWDGIKLLLGLI